MFAKIHGARIAAIRAAVPTQKICIEDELEYYGGSLKKAQRAKAMIGIDRRRPAWPGQTASDLCYAAASSLLADHPDVKENIDALIFVSQSPDYPLPATACILQERLGLPQTCAAFDVNQGCAGFVYGLWLASSLASSGCKNVLILAGDAPIWPRDASNRIIAPIFGDGGGAALVSASDSGPEITFSIGRDGSGHDVLIMPAGCTRLPFSWENNDDNLALIEKFTDASGASWRLYDIYMNGKKVFEFTMRVVPDHIKEFLQQTSTSVDNIDYFMLHQANRQIVGEIAKKAGLPPEKTPSESFSKFGNLSSTSIPAAICDLFGEKGSTRNATMLLCGYGVGLSWASCLWHSENCDVKPVIDVPKPENAPAWKEKIKYWRDKISGEAE